MKRLDLISELVRLNTSKTIKIRKNAIANGYSLFLEYNKDHRRQRTFLDLRISNKTYLTKEDQETLYKAEIIRDTKELELFGNTMTFALQNKLSEMDFINYFKEMSNKKNLPSYKYCINHLIEFTNIYLHKTNLKFSDIDTNFCQKFKEFLQKKITDKKLANQTAKTYLTVFSATLNAAFIEKIIPINPAARIRIKSIDSKREFLTEEELKQLLLVDTPHIEIKNAFIFASQTSLRLGDLRKLTFHDIRVNKTNEAYLYFRQSKTKTVSHIKLSQLAYKIYLEQKNRNHESNNVFDLPVSKSNINDRLREMALDAGIVKHISFHVSRHSWATLALSKGVDIYTVSKIMGHSSVAVTEIYSNLINKKRDEVSDIIDLEITEEDLAKRSEIIKKKVMKQSSK